jgi:hypothetical protein
MKISEWLNEYVDSHSIYDSRKMRESFMAQTGLEPIWPEHTHEQTRASIVGRGLGGYLKTDVADDLKECWGYQMADSLASHYAKFHSSKMGRGFLFDDCITGLKKAGF